MKSIHQNDPRRTSKDAPGLITPSGENLDDALRIARLNAAAPDLLEAVKAALAWRLNGEGKGKPDNIYLNDTLRSAIIKAEGR